MADRIVLDGEVSLTNVLDGVAGTVIRVETETGIDSIVFNDDYTLTFNMTNGDTYTTGSIRGERGETGATGPQGEKGNDYTLTPADKSEIAGLVDVPVSDVQIDGTSVLQNGVANFERPIWPKYGVVKVSGDYGIGVNANGVLFLHGANDSDIKDGTNIYKASLINKQHASVFYGLAKASGDVTQALSDNAVGTYTPEALTAIQQMLGVYQAPFHTIKEITITEETWTVFVDSDADGNPFALKEAIVLFDKLIATGSGTLWIAINKNSRLTSADAPVTPFLTINAGFSTAERTSAAHMWLSSGRFFGNSTNDNLQQWYTTTTVRSTKNAFGFIECGSIESLLFYSPNDYKFTSGTITIIGR